MRSERTAIRTQGRSNQADIFPFTRKSRLGLEESGARWHLLALPTTLAKLDSISATPLRVYCSAVSRDARKCLALRAQASRKEKRPHPAPHTPLIPTSCTLSSSGGERRLGPP